MRQIISGLLSRCCGVADGTCVLFPCGISASLAMMGPILMVSGNVSLFAVGDSMFACKRALDLVGPAGTAWGLWEQSLLAMQTTRCAGLNRVIVHREQALLPHYSRTDPLLLLSVQQRCHSINFNLHSVQRQTRHRNQCAHRLHRRAPCPVYFLDPRGQFLLVVIDDQ